MRIGILVPSLYMHGEEFRKRISAPMELSISLADGLIDKGNEVFFFSGPQIPTKAEVLSFDEELLDKDLHMDYQQDLLPENYDAVSFYERKKYYELCITEKAYQFAQKQNLDILHVYHAYGNLAHYFAELLPVPTVFTLHVFPPPEHTLERWRYNRFKNQNFIAISNSQKNEFKEIVPGINILDTIYHGLESPMNYNATQSHDYFAFIGRLIPQKGPDLAIQIASKLKINLHIATDVNPVIEKSLFYKEKILPYIDNKSIKINGLLVGKDKFSFLSNAKAFLFPLQWNEPFGMVLIESLSVGTPVIAYKRGSVPEIIEDGVTGFLVDPKEGMPGMIAAVKKLQDLSLNEYMRMRKACRASFEEKFTRETMVHNYEKAYQKILS